MELVNKTIGECLSERVVKTPERTAIETKTNHYTWKEIDFLSDYFAVRLLACGVVRGAMVGIWSANSPNWVITFLALAKLGAVPVLFNCCSSSRELAALIRYTGVEFVCYGDGYKDIMFEDIVRELKKTLEGQVRWWIAIGRNHRSAWWDKEDFLRTEKTKKALLELKLISAQVQSDDTAAILFTSGTTARAKGVMLSHYSLVNNAREMSEHMQWHERDRMLIAVPLFHCFGVTASLLSGICSGYAMYLVEYYKSAEVLQMISEHRCTLMNGVPSMFLALVQNKDFAKYDLSSLRRGIVAGAPILPDEYVCIRNKIPTLDLFASYGQTETSPCVTISDIEDTASEKAVSVGRAMANVSLRIADFNTKESAGKKNGEIQVKGYNVMQGYLHLPEETAAIMTGDGWLRTGDMGYIDADGFLHITGRIKEIIIRGGENIAPREIEEVIKDYPGVKDVKVVGVPAKIMQEEIAACVVLEDNVRFCRTELITFLKRRLACFKIPKYILLFERFPLNASGKIKINDVKKEAITKINQMKTPASGIGING